MVSLPSQKGCKFCFSYLPSVGDNSFKSSKQGFTFKSFLYKAKGKWRSTTVKLYIARPHMMPIKWNQLCSTKHCKTTQRNPDETHCHACNAQYTFPHGLRSQPLLFQLGQNQSAPIRSQFGCESFAGVWHRNEDSETKPCYFCKPWLAVETATAAFHLICLLFPFYIPLHFDINKASMFAVYVLQENALRILSLPPILSSIKSLCITTVPHRQIYQHRCWYTGLHSSTYLLSHWYTSHRLAAYIC